MKIDVYFGLKNRFFSVKGDNFLFQSIQFLFPQLLPSPEFFSLENRVVKQPSTFWSKSRFFDQKLVMFILVSKIDIFEKKYFWDISEYPVSVPQLFL